jgi:hypothetical protein
MSPSLIVGICILGAIFFCVILASIVRLCTRDTGPENTENLYRPGDPDQLERMSEVRRINNKMAWERGIWAKRELVKQGRRLTVGWEEGMESLSMLEGQVCNSHELGGVYEIGLSLTFLVPRMATTPRTINLTTRTTICIGTSIFIRTTTTFEEGLDMDTEQASSPCNLHICRLMCNPKT